MGYTCQLNKLALIVPAHISESQPNLRYIWKTICFINIILEQKTTGVKTQNGKNKNKTNINKNSNGIDT